MFHVHSQSRPGQLQKRGEVWSCHVLESGAVVIFITITQDKVQKHMAHVSCVHCAKTLMHHLTWSYYNPRGFFQGKPDVVSQVDFKKFKCTKQLQMLFESELQRCGTHAALFVMALGLL